MTEMEEDSEEMSKRTLFSGLSGSSGTYNVEESELLQNRDPRPTSKLNQAFSSDKPAKTIGCTVIFLDETQHTFNISKLCKGQVLLDLVFEHLELIERDYFGLQYLESYSFYEHNQSSFHNGINGFLSHINVVSTPNSPTTPVSAHSQFSISNEPMRWLEASKSLKKQLRGGIQFYLYFRVKFYVSDSSKLQEEYTRYHFFLQVRKDILDGKLLIPHKSAVLLASYAAQSELGDYNPEEHKPGYLSKLLLLPNQTSEIENEISELHMTYRGQTPADVEFNFLDHARRLDMYGIQVYKAKDSSNNDMSIGVGSAGVVVFQNNIKINTFCWAKIIKISFKRKRFFIQLRRSGLEKFDSMIGFNLMTYRSCKDLWKSCVEHHTFFRLQSPKPQTKRFFFFFHLGSKFRCSGKTEYQTLEEGRKRARAEKTFERMSLRRFARSTVPSILSSRIENENVRNSKDIMASNKLLNGKNMVIRSFPGKSSTQDSQSDDFSSVLNNDLSHHQNFKGQDNLMCGNNYVMSELVKNDEIKRSNCEEEEREEGKIESNGALLSYRNIPFIDGNEGSFSKEPSLEKQIQNVNKNGNFKNLRLSIFTDESPTHTQPLTIIRMKPDEQGRFGFNVKGGADQNLPVLVSRVAPNTPADNSEPKLSEGDQVISVNGNDVDGLTHDQVVKLIRSTKDSEPDRELVLIIRPNVYNRDIGESRPNVEDELPFEYIPVDASPATRNRSKCDRLHQSIMLLCEGLESDALITQFEQLFRKKPGELMDIALHPDNVLKNRYRDISPYDSTRVILKDGQSGNYVNASYVNMEIPRSGIVNRYIATQGPLSTTCNDFWQMVWEQRSSLIVMVTPLIERERVKCHKYWPDLNETGEYANYLISCIKEENMSSMMQRELVILEKNSGEKRDVIHLQYLAWPDHEVPDDAHDFLGLVFKVRDLRAGVIDPVIVHCSAGIGRTGVLILMETAMCLIEANEPIYPLEILKSMRDQRAMLIQTSNQFKFVLEAIVKVYKERIVEPLKECITK